MDGVAAELERAQMGGRWWTMLLRARTSNVGVLTKELEPAAAVGEVLNDGIQLAGLIGRPVRRLLGKHHVGVHVRVDDVAVVIAAHRPLDADQAMLGGRSDHRIGQPVKIAPRLAVRLRHGAFGPDVG